MPVERLLQLLPHVPHESGVYRMVNAQKKDLYIGKAKDLYQRLSSYTRLNRLPHRLQQMLHHMQDVLWITTQNELEALLLEANLIQRHKPTYNILLKYGDNFSYLTFSKHTFPQVRKQRIIQDNQYIFGPFLSASAADTLWEWMQKIFRLRVCSDRVFSQRSRPCLQYDMGRCSAPCVQKVTSEQYAEQLQSAVQFLRHGTQALRKKITSEMQQASQQQDYKKALLLRNQIRALDYLAPSQMHHNLRHGDCIAIVYHQNALAIHCMCWRHEAAYGSENFIFSKTTPQDIPEVLASFLKIFYTQSGPPKRLVLNAVPEDEASLKLLFKHHFDIAPHFVYPKKGPLLRIIRSGEEHARQAIEKHQANQKSHQKLWEGLSQHLKLSSIPQRIEVYDNSHHQGDCALAAMIVADAQGFLKKEYRTFSMDSQDDFHMMRSVIRRRFESQSSGHYAARPDMMIIDGGLGQLHAVLEALQETGIEIPCVISIAKSADGDRVFDARGQQIQLETAYLHLIQRLRDEVHRFAVHTHRRLKTKKMTHSVLSDIPGIGGMRRRQLLEAFQSVEALSHATQEELARILPSKIARNVYDYFRKKR